jgi:excisionase family DNA binding protein
VYAQDTLYSGAVVMSALMTAREVADLLGVSTETVLRWTRRGDLPAIRLPGGAIRFRVDELEEWLARRATSRNSLTPASLTPKAS